MPGSVHEGVRLLFQNRPELLRELLAALGIELPAGALVEDANAFSDLSPPTYAADLVLNVRDRGVVGSLIGEVQGAIDGEKRFAWPRYVATVHASRKCPVWLIVVATTREVAAWARRPIETFQPGSDFRPIVIGPDDVPRIVDEAAARMSPELAVLSAVVHGATDDGAIGTAAITAARELDDERQRLYTDLTFGSLNEIARAAVEAIMRDRGYEPLTEIGRQMLQQGRAEGESRGRVEGLREALGAACRALGIEWTPERQRVAEALDQSALRALLEAVVTTRRWPTH